MRRAIIGLLSLLASAQIYAENAAQFVEKHLQDLDKNADLSGYFVERPQFIFGHHIHIPDSSPQASDYVRDLQKRLREKGYAKTIIDGSKVLAEIEDYSLVTFSLSRLTADDELLDKTCNTYGVIHLKFGYKILSWQPSEPDKEGACW